MAAPTADFMSNGMTIREDTPTDTSSMANSSSPEDPLSSDWSQWMRWDDLDVDDTSDHVNHPDTLLLRPDARHERIVMPGDLNSGMLKPDYSFQSPMSQNTHHGHLRGLSASSMDFSPDLCPPSFTSPFPTDPVPSTISMMNLQSQYPQQRQFQQQTSYPGAQQVNKTNILMSPLATTPPSRKRKTSTDEETPIDSIAASSTPASKNAPSKKRSHNVIEKRYRANLNDKIAELRDAVPSLRAVFRQRNGSKPEDEEDEAIASGNKLNKASILSKATEYIKHLEVRNKRLDEENMALKNRLREQEKTQEQGMMSFGSAAFAPGLGSSPGGYTVSSESATDTSPGVFSHTEEFSPEGSPNPLYPPEGLIKVPEYFKRMRATTGPQPHYADSFLSRQNPNHRSDESAGRPRGVANKFMIGTLAGLMVVGGLESRKAADGAEKGLLALPFQYLSEAYEFSQRYFYLFRTASWYIRAGMQVMMTSAFVIGCAFVVFLYLFYSRPRGFSKQRAAQATSTAVTPAEFRREAWLTSIQTVGVPSHTFFPEWYAVTSRCLEYCLRCILGWSLYSWITGICEDDENGRVKAWDIALDAQLTGGDAEVSKSRLVLTIFAAGTLPRSPARCMLKSMHCRVLLWRVGVQESVTGEVADTAAFAFARYQWQLAQQMQKNTPKDHEDHLPSHLSFLLTMDCDDILTDNIIQRSANMIWNRPTQEATEGEDALLDVVVEDTAIRSPLDALAAWWSSTALQDALIHSFDSTATDCNTRRRKGFEKRIDLALKSAPVTSCAYTRAAVIKAVFFDEGRVGNINAVLAALPKPKINKSNNATIFVDTSVPPSARDEISTAVRCAMIAAILKGQVGSKSPQFTLRNAIELFNKLPVDPVELTLLGFSSLYHLLHIVASDERLMPSSSLSSSVYSSSLTDGGCESDAENEKSDERLPLPDLGRVASGLIYWVRNAYNPISSGFTTSIAENVVDGCVEACGNAGLHIDVDVIDREMTRTTEADAQVEIVTEETDVGKKQEFQTPAETSSEESETNGSRRDSIESADTGCTSPKLASEDVKVEAN